MKHIILTICLLVSVNVIYAQPEVIWSQAYGGGGTDQGLAIIQAENGEIVVSGNETSFGGGGTDGWLLILDLDGEEVWSAYGGGRGYDRFYGVLEIDGGFVVSGYQGSFGAGQFDFWLLQIDDEGEGVWARAFGGNQHDRGYKLIQTENGGYVFVGGTDSFGEGGGDGWVVATDDEGREDWTQTFGGNGADVLSDICHADEDNIMVVGRTNSEGEGGNDIFLFKINAEGDEIWSRTYGGEEDEQCQSIIRTNDDCYVMAGSTVSFGENGSDLWLLKVNEDGEEIWSRTFDNAANDLCRSVIQTIDGGYLLVGQNNLHTDARCDAWIVRADEDGEEMWSETYGGDQADVGVDVVQLEDGGYAMTGWTSSFDLGGLDVWVMRFGPEPAGVIYGFVNDAQTDEPIEGAAITTTNGLSAETNEEGFYIIEPAWAGDFEMTASKPGWNDSTIMELSLEFDDTLEINFGLLHPEFEPSRVSFVGELELNESYEFNFSIENNGNGTLEYQVEKRLLGDANAEPFELRQTDEIEGDLEDNFLAGAVFVDEYFYISGGNNGNNPNKIYILNMEREIVDEFDQFTDDRYGMRDLTYDGRLIWGAVQGTFYGFTTDGCLEISFEFIPVNGFEGRCFAWDAENDLLWVTDIASDIYGINRDGDLIRTIENNDLRIYGLGYWPDDPDGYNLYVFSRGPDNVGITVSKLNLANGDYMEVVYFDIGEGRPGGFQITNQLDIYSWVMVALVQNPDRLNVWQLEGRKGWFDVVPDVGEIEAGESQDFTLTLDATGLPEENELLGEAVFMHNAIQAETALSVTLNVVGGPPPGWGWINLHIGWNTVSINLQPHNHENIEYLVSRLVENDLLIMMKNGAGEFYRPEFEFNNIPGWFSYEGYQMLMSGAAVLALRGESVLRDDPIDLQEGWQLISYYPRFEVEATLALSGIVEQLVIAKDGHGNFYLPAWDDFSNMGNMGPGNGYFINVSADDTLIYRLDVDDEERLMSGADIPVCRSDQAWLSEPQPGECSFSLLLLTEDLSSGTRLEAYTPSGELAGRGIVDDDGKCGMALWGKDVGFSDGDKIRISIPGGADIPVCQLELQWLDGETSGWKADGWGVARLTGSTEMPVEFGIVSAYPNPFNSTTRITYSLPEAAIVNLTLFDISGREVASIVNGYRKAGVYEANISAENLSSGLYFIKLDDSKQIVTRKLMLIK